MQSADTQTDCPPLLRGPLSLRQRISIEIDHIIQRPDRHFYDGTQLGFIFSIQPAKIQRCQIADHHFSGFGLFHDHGFAIDIH